MIELDYAGLAAAPAATDPFPQVVVPGFGPASSLAACRGALPTLVRRGNGEVGVFPHGPVSWDGQWAFVGERYSVQLNYMTTDDKARSEMRRHRISAFVKRLTRAA